MATEHFDVAVVGGGSGLTAAHYAVQDGKSVALIDALPDALGGTCVNRGCLPTKGLVAVADVLRTVRTADGFDISVPQNDVRVDFASVMRRIRDQRAKRARGVRSWVEDAMTPYFGRARFVGEKLLEMDDGRRLTAERIFLAPGARPAVPPIEGIDDVSYLTNVSALELETLPERMVVIGGGYIGCEFAHAFDAFGVAVTILHADAERLLSEDHDIGDIFTEALGRRVRLELGCRATSIEQVGGGVRVGYRRGDERGAVEGDAVLVAAGRAPNTAELELDATGVRTDERGWIDADDCLRTSHPDIFAYGDCIGRAMFKHTSSAEGFVAYRNAHGDDRAMSYDANPHAVFSDPEIGAVGLTEQACREQGLSYRTASVPYDDIAKGQILGSPPGLAKVIVEEGSQRILGFHLAGPNAAILVQEVVLAMSTGATASAIRDAIHVHPAMSELVHAAFAKL